MQNNPIETAFADGLRQKWALGLQNVCKPEFRGVEDWLQRGSYAWRSNSPGKVELELTSSQTGLTEALASDISRFSCAAYESLLESDAGAPSSKSIGWQLVRHYYAAFYCAHALLRISGTSLSFLSAEVVSKLNLVGGQYLGASPQLTKGLYSIKRISSNSNVVCIERLSQGGGSHEDMWKQFLSLMVEIENSILQMHGGTQHSVEAVEISKALRLRLCHKGMSNGAWPSGVRNAINYRHEHEVWYPYGKNQTFYESVTRKLKHWKPSDPNGFLVSQPSVDLMWFAEICNLLSHILIAVLRDISFRSPSAKKSFVDRVTFKFLHERGVAI